MKPAEAAKRLRAVTLAVTHPVLNDAPMSSRDVAKQFLYGVHARSGHVLIKVLQRAPPAVQEAHLGRRRAADRADQRRAHAAHPQRAHHRQRHPASATSPTSGAWAAFMLGFSLIQIAFSIGAVYLGARIAMGFGRDLRNSLFHQVTSFSAREVGTHRRSVAHHAHHQRRATNPDARGDGVHDGDRRADHDGRRRDHGAAPGRRPVVDARGRDAGVDRSCSA